MNFDCGIYAITSPSGRQYIGQAKSFKIRWKRHRHELRAGTHHCASLLRAYKKYGMAALVFSKIAIVPVEQLDKREQEQIDDRPRHMLYNTALDVVAPQRGLAPSKETRLKIAATKVGKPRSLETRMKLSAWRTGQTTSAEVRAKISASGKGMKRSPKTCQNISKALKGQIRTPEQRATNSLAHIGKYTGADSPVARAVVCIETSTVFVSGFAAIEWLRATSYPKASSSLITKVCRGKKTKAYGYRWAYADSYSGDERKLFTTPVNPVMFETAFCAAAPTATDALDQIDVPATVGAVICAPEFNFPINAENVDAACALVTRG